MSRTRTAKRRDRPHLAPDMGARKRRVLRVELRARDGDDCFYCLRPLEDDQTVEHFENWGSGGSNHPNNLVLAHVDCNWATKDLTVDQKMLARGDALLAMIEREQRRAA